MHPSRVREHHCPNCDEETEHHEMRLGVSGEVGWVCGECGAENLLGDSAAT